MSLPAGTGSGASVLVTARSADVVVVVVAVAPLFADVESGVGDDAVAVLVIVVPLAVVGLTRTTMVKMAVGGAGAMLPMVHETVPVVPTPGAAQLQPVGASSERKVVLDGTVSVIVTLAALLGPVFVTPIV